MKLIHSLPKDNHIGGLTILNDELFVKYLNKPISVYNKNTFSLQRTIDVPGCGGVADMTSCQRCQCVYISDFVNNLVHRIDNIWNETNQWPVYDKPNGLSVNSSSNVLVTCDKVGRIREFTTDGQFLREILLQSDILNPSHAAELTADHFVVCHGCPGDKLHRICIVNNDGNVLYAFGGAPGSGDEQLNFPNRVIVGGFILVSEVINDRVLMVSPSSKCVRAILSGPETPLRMCFDEATGRLFVADCKYDWDKEAFVSGQVNIYSLFE